MSQCAVSGGWRKERERGEWRGSSEGSEGDGGRKLMGGTGWLELQQRQPKSLQQEPEEVMGDAGKVALLPPPPLRSSPPQQGDPATTRGVFLSLLPTPWIFNAFCLFLN
eukprot:77317-Hanusia_phi.AAC.2